MNDSKKHRSLSPQQRTRLVTLLRGPSRLADEPKTNSSAGAWRQTYRSLAERGFAVQEIHGGSDAYALTDAGRSVAEAIVAKAKSTPATLGAAHGEGAALQ